MLVAIATGIAKRDLDLAKPRLLDTAQFPTLTVDVTGVIRSTPDWRARGMVGLRGITFAVDLAITVDQLQPSGDVSVHVTTAFDRTPIGMKAPSFVISKKIEVSVDATFTYGLPVERGQQ